MDLHISGILISRILLNQLIGDNMVKCYKCETNNVDNAVYCQECGLKLVKDERNIILKKTKRPIFESKNEIEEEKNPQIRERRKMKFKKGTAKLLLRIPNGGEGNLTQAAATATLGLAGYALTNKKGKKYKVKVQVTDSTLKIRGEFTGEIPLEHVKMVTMERITASEKLIVYFEAIPPIEFLPYGGRLTYPSILYEMLKPFDNI